MIAALKGSGFDTKVRKSPRPHQKEAIDAALHYFELNSRGQLISPCGSGKTLMALWITEALSPQRALIMVPSLALVAQTLKEWAEYTTHEPFKYLALCSDQTVSAGRSERGLQ